MDNAGKLPFSALHEIALKEARKIHREKVEHAAVIDEMGNVTRIVGNGDEVGILPHLVSSARIIIHNHPHDFKEPSSFSGDDVYNLLHYNLDEIIVCGYGCYFYMRKGTCILRSMNVRSDLNRIYKQIDSEMKKVYLPGNRHTDTQSILKDYRTYKVKVESEYHKELRSYSQSKGLSYRRGKL